MNTVGVSNSLDQDQASCFVGLDPDPHCLQKLSADDTSRYSRTDNGYELIQWPITKAPLYNIFITCPYISSLFYHAINVAKCTKM